ncbi:MAG TPA: mycothiol synthase [Natronosporangium sp.]|nr:mycothiol synthase [Natronosporangium sp.]
MTTAPGPITVTTSAGPLSTAEVDQVLALADTAAATDGTYPFSEQVVLQLRHGGGVHLLARDSAGRVVGYGQLDLAGDPSAELVVHPEARRAGIGRRLLAAAQERIPADRPPLRVWSHGDLPEAAATAQALGFRRVRVLHQLRRSLQEPIPEPVLPDGVQLRPFQPGVDDAQWLTVNARAFADHPEQGRWTADDLRMRMAEPWFDPEGFLLAVRSEDDRLLGFHWTKVHGPGNWHHGEPIGEVYVVGVDPAAHGTGLGTALTLAGLRYLRDRGLEQVMLYVDDDNQPARRLYARLGFTAHAVDVMWQAAA